MKLNAGKRGEPEMSDRITIRITPSLEAALDRFIADRPGTIKSRQEAFRLIACEWLETQGYGPVASDSGKPAEERRSITDVLSTR